MSIIKSLRFHPLAAAVAKPYGMAKGLATARHATIVVIVRQGPSGADNAAIYEAIAALETESKRQSQRWFAAWRASSAAR